MKDKLLRLKNTDVKEVEDNSRVVFSLLDESVAFPLVIKPRYSGSILTKWVLEQEQLLNEKLTTHGAILFRGFHVDTIEMFREFVDVFRAAPLEYKQRSSPRYEVAQNIYESTTYPSDQPINMHSENSYATNWVKRIIFCCITPADEQGETPIADNRLVLKYLSETTKEKFREKGVKYVRNISAGIGLSWREIFQTDDRAVVEAECAKDGISFRWEDNDRLVLSWKKDAIYRHPVTGEDIWFNHAFFFNKYAYDGEIREGLLSDDRLPFNTIYGDGTEISKEEIDEIRMAYSKATFKFLWNKGDVLYMDNMLFSHGRSPFKGERQIVVAMF